MDLIALKPLAERAAMLSNRLEDNEKKERCLKMIEILLKNHDWPDLKIGGWLEHVVTVCIEQKITTINEERDFSRKIKHEYYKRISAKIPKTINLDK